MSTPPPKAPPRFVPTLTDVVHVAEADDLSPPRSVATAAPPWASSSTSSSPPPVVLPADETFVPVAPPPWAARSTFADVPPAQPSTAVISHEPSASGTPAVSFGIAPVVAPFTAPVSSPWSAISDLASPISAAGSTPPPAAATTVAPATPALPHGFEEHLVHRVMQRVDVVLDQRLREAIATVVQEQTRSMVPRLREEVESVVRHAVYEAVAEELSNDRGPLA